MLFPRDAEPACLYEAGGKGGSLPRCRRSAGEASPRQRVPLRCFCDCSAGRSPSPKRGRPGTGRRWPGRVRPTSAGRLKWVRGSVGAVYGLSFHDPDESLSCRILVPNAHGPETNDGSQAADDHHRHRRSLGPAPQTVLGAAVRGARSRNQVLPPTLPWGTLQSRTTSIRATKRRPSRSIGCSAVLGSMSMRSSRSSGNDAPELQRLPR